MVYVMLPAYNEEEGLGLVLEKLHRLSLSLKDRLRVIVVDDGSRDRTSEVAQSFSQRLDLKLIKFEKNQGVGEVFKKGLRFVCEDSPEPEEDICVVLDSDNTQDPETIPSMIQKIKQGDDIVIASRFQPGGGMSGCPLGRRLLSFAVSFLMRIVLHFPRVRDYSTFYRAYRVSLLQRGFATYGDDLLYGAGFAAVAGLLLKLGEITLRISEVPSILRYELKKGASGIKIFKTIRGYLSLLYEYGKGRRLKKCYNESLSYGEKSR